MEKLKKKTIFFCFLFLLDFDVVLSTANSEVLFENPSSGQSTAFCLMTWVFPSLTKTNFSLLQIDSSSVSVDIYYTNKLFVSINR
jgi:hypothetical protein